MEEHRSNFKARLGFFVLAGLALMVLGIFYIGKQKHLFNQVFQLTTTFRNISGLQIGNNVRFSGINVGTVDNIQIINDTTVKVYLIIDKEVQKFIKTDSYVTINSEGIIGDRIANITQGAPGADEVKDGAQLRSFEPVETDAILSSLAVTGQNAEVVSGQLAEILYRVNHGNGTLAKLIRDSSIADNFRQVMVNLKKGTKGLDENMEAAKHNILFRGYFKNKKKEEERKLEEKKNGKDKKDDKNSKTWAQRWRDRRKERAKEKEAKREQTARAEKTEMH